MKPLFLNPRAFLLLALASLAPAQDVKIDSDTFGGLAGRFNGDLHHVVAGSQRGEHHVYDQPARVPLGPFGHR